MIKNDKELLTKADDDDEDQGICSPSRRNSTIVWSLLICFGLVAVVGAIIGIIFGVISATGDNSKKYIIFICYDLNLDSSSANFVSSLRKGPGDNSN